MLESSHVSFALVWARIVLCVCIGHLLFASGVSWAEDEATLTSKGDVAYNRGDLVSAMHWYRQAAQAGDARAQVKLAFILDYSGGGEEALLWFNKAAQQGNAEGQYGLARMLVSGESTTRDPVQAHRWMKAAAEQNFLPAVTALARMLESGLPGVAKDLLAAADYWRKAAELGDQSAMQRLASAYRKAELGLAIDLQRAQEWEARLRSAIGNPTPSR